MIQKIIISQLFDFHAVSGCRKVDWKVLQRQRIRTEPNRNHRLFVLYTIGKKTNLS